MKKITIVVPDDKMALVEELVMAITDMEIVEVKDMGSTEEFLRKSPCTSCTDPGPDVVNKCFIFTSDFVKEKVEAIVKKYYTGSHADLALIEITLFDHGQLRKRNSHKAFVRSLAVWGILNVKTGEEMKPVIDCIRDKFSRLPKDGYKEWGQNFLNEKNTCINIGRELDSMPYIRKKEE